VAFIFVAGDGGVIDHFLKNMYKNNTIGDT
jgi:hypothetical protein